MKVSSESAAKFPQHCW